MTIGEALNAADHSVIEMSIPATKTSSETFKPRERSFVLLDFLKGKHIKTGETEIHSQQESLLGHGLSTVTPTMYPPTPKSVLKKEEEQQQKEEKGRRAAAATTKKSQKNDDTSVCFENTSK